ncbi:L-tyrosine/L-tryptophan isonitrile synthase family protein [Micromonospora sp. NPDC048999]|uniref:L-tyrosine/L-tryptophan isonitrile synthase family protein n=1 Tax=Micromonospora sp. NPDC048999 TaxID=3155391 RepID=UPI0033D40FFC
MTLRWVTTQPFGRPVEPEVLVALRRLAAAGTNGLDQVDEVLVAELRHLSPASTEALRAAGLPGRGVGRRQQQVLTDVLNRVVERARRRRSDPALRRPAVLLDLDLCALNPRDRTVRALRETGARHGIVEFADPDLMSQWPTYHPASWQGCLDRGGLRDRYPDVDWADAYRDYCQAFFEPWDRLADDEPTPGLPRFVWDVFHAGGCVVFSTGRRERVRRYSEASLARAGVLRPRLVMLPDDRTRPVHELKAENMAAFADLDVVAVFDDLCDNRRAIAKQLPDVLCVAVELPGFALEHPAGCPDDGAEVIVSFERVPRTGRTVAVAERADLSHTLSLAELPVGELADHRTAAAARAVRLSTGESRRLVDVLLGNADAAAGRVAEAARRGHPDGDPLRLLHHVLTRERFRKGPRGNYPLTQAQRDLRPFVDRGEPVPVVTFGFPVKLHYNDLKTTGPRPDLAELGALVRMRELQHAVREVYPPGLRITVLSDGNHFHPRPAALLRAYHDKLADYHTLVGGADILEITDVEDVAAAVLGADVRLRRQVLLDAALGELDATLADLDVTTAPLTALEEASDRCAALLGNRGDGTVMPRFVDLWRSLLYVVPVVPPPTVARHAWARLLYADILHVTDPRLGPDRQRLLAEAWQRTLRYLAVLSVDRDLRYDDTTFFPGRVRLTPNPRPGSLGFTYLGGAGVLPWHGTAALDPLGQLSTDFAVALYDRGYVPVYSPLLGDDQPWFLTSSRP